MRELGVGVTPPSPSISDNERYREEDGSDWDHDIHSDDEGDT